MSSKSSDANAANSAPKAKDDVAKQKKLRKDLKYLFTQNGLEERKIPHVADDEVSVEDMISSGHYKGKYSVEDFDRAVAKDSHDIILKEESHFLLIISNGRHVVKYFKEGLEYKGGADLEEAMEEDVNEEQGEWEENEKIEHTTDSATGTKRKKNKKNKKAASSSSQADTDEHQSDKKEKRPETSQIKNSEMELKQNKSGKQPAEELGKAGKQIEKSPEKDGKQTEESLGKEGKQTEKPLESGGKQTEESPGKDRKQTQKSPEKGGMQTDKSLGKDRKQTEKTLEKGEKQTEESPGKSKKQTESLGKGKKQTDKSQEKGGKQRKDQKVTEPKENAAKQKIDKTPKTEKMHKMSVDDVSNSSAAFSSDEEKASASAAEPPKKKNKNKPEDRLKKTQSTFNFLFGKGGLKEKEIKVGDDGFVKVKSIIEAFADQYNWTEQEIYDAFANNKEYIFKRDGTDGWLVKSTAEQKSEVVNRPVEIQEPGTDDSWKESGGKRKSQDDRKLRSPQNNAAGRSTGFSSMMPPDKLCNTLYWILAKDGAAQHSVQFQPEKRLYVDEIIKKVPALHQVLASEVKSAVESDSRKSFVVEGANGQMMIRLQESRSPRDRNTESPGKSDFHLSKTMSFLLRHGADRLQLPIKSDGFIFVDDLLAYKDLRCYKEDDVKRVVRDNDKQRFLLAQDPQTGRLKVRANQGHTFVVPDLELQPITNANDAPAVVHGTYHTSWKAIQKQGLSRMSRNHIHFAAGEPGDDGVISGMRGSCEIIIFLDLEKALNDGLKFFRSANNVILSPGDDKGIVEPKYFKSVIQRHPRVKLV